MAGSIHVPFVTAKQNLWAGVRSDVYGSTVEGKPVLPSNTPNPFQDPPVPVTPVVDEFVVIPPNVDPTSYFYDNRCVYLEPGGSYLWSGIKITRPLIIYGRGATIRLNGEGPILEVTTGLNVAPSDCPFTVYDVIFHGNEDVNRNQAMSNSFVNKSAIWITNAWKSSLVNCSFLNFNGAALWYRDDALYTEWKQQHAVLGCKFYKCRIGVANSGRSEYSIADSNCFFDCCVCFNVIGGNWRQSSNQIAASKCAYLHVESGMWYEGSNKQNPAHGAFTGNTLNHCDSGCLWPQAWTLADGRQIARLGGMYFDSSVSFPPTFSDNTLWYSGIELRGFSTGSQLKTYCFTGCTFMGNPNNTTQSRIAIVREGTSNNSKVFFIGCTGNNIAVYNVAQANITPLFGTLQTGTYDSEYPVRRQAISNTIDNNSVDDNHENAGNLETNEIMEIA